MKKKNFCIYFYFLCLLSSIFLPYINVAGLSLYGTAIFSFVFLPFIFNYNVRLDKYVILIFLLVVMVFLSSLYSSAFGLSSSTYRNYIEAFKYAQFLPYLIFAQYLRSDNFYNIFDRIVIFITYFYIFVFLVQYLNILGLRDFFVAIYLGDGSSHLDDIARGWRLTMTGAGPNEGAAIGVFLLIYNLAKSSMHFNKQSFLLGLSLIFIILSTQSRTALVGMLFSVLFIFIFNTSLSFIKKVLVLTSLFSVFIYLFLHLDLEYIKKGFELMRDGENNSLNVRLDRKDVALDLFDNSPIFGIGPAKNEYSTILDSEYLLIIQRYGIFGIFIFIVFIFNMLVDGFRNRYNVIGLTLLCYTVFTLFVMLTNNAYSGYQLMSISVCLIVALSIVRRKNFN